MARYEAGIFNRFDHKTIITEVDRSLIPHPDRDDIVVVPNGVDFERFSCHGERKEYDLIFSGNMGYAPNVDAALFLAENILPELLPDFPDLKLVLCGASPSPRVLALQGEHVLVTGWVDSMAEWYAKSKVFVAPMRMGTGLQNKLLEAMAMSLPCVTSPLAAKPLMEAGQHHAVLTCETAGQFADTLRRLLQDAEYSQEVATAGNQYVRQYYDWKAAVDLLENVMTGS